MGALNETAKVLVQGIVRNCQSASKTEQWSPK